MSPKFKDYKEVIRLYKLGVPMAEIARRQNPPVTRQTIWNALKRRGLIRSRHGLLSGQGCDSDDN